MADRALLAASLAACLLLPGCLGLGEARTEWAFTVTQLDQMPALGFTGRGVTVAVLDTGVDPRHPALTHLFDGNQDNGEVADFRDFVNGRSGLANAYDDDGHGSHVLGIVGAAGSTLSDQISYGGINLLGGAPDATFLVAKVCVTTRDGSEEGCSGQAVVNGIRWAVQNGARILSLSLGGDAVVGQLGPLSPPDELQQAIDAAIDDGIVVVASAGNEGPNNSDVSSPASIPGVLAVGAITSDGQVWEKSNRGDDAGNPCQTLPVVGVRGRCDPHKKPELVAPGVEILSVWRDGGYARASGTSQATPFVTSAVAMLLQGRADLSDRGDVERIKSVLTQTAKKVGGQALPHDEAAGYGVLQVRSALDAYRPA